MKALVRLSLLIGLVLSLGLSLSHASGLPDTPDPTEPAIAKPTILKVEPGLATPWSYIMITGENLMSADGSCSVEVSGVFSYVANCSPSEIRAVVPWTAQTGSVVVSADGAGSNAFPIEITPLKLDSREIVAGEIHLEVRPEVDIGSVVSREGDSALSVKPLGDPDSPYMKDWYGLKVPRGSEVAEATAYSQHAEVLYAAPVPIPVPADAPNDPYYASQWALPKIGAPTAWSHSKGSGIKIAVIDSGFATSHPDLAAHMTAGWNCNGGRDVSPLAGDTHGTFVAGIAAAVTNNSEGVAGVGWNSSILPLRLDVLSGGSCSLGGSSEVFFIDKAIAEGADVVNTSYTYGSHPIPAGLREHEQGVASRPRTRGGRWE